MNETVLILTLITITGGLGFVVGFILSLARKSQ